MKYTYKDYINDARKVFAQFAPKKYRDTILGADIRFKCQPDEPNVLMQLYLSGQVLHANTVENRKTGKKWIEVYANATPQDHIALAYTVGHELAHLLGPQDDMHGPAWAKRANAIGVAEVPYLGQTHPFEAIPRNGTHDADWSRPEVLAAIRALPVPNNWDEVEKDLTEADALAYR